MAETSKLKIEILLYVGLFVAGVLLFAVLRVPSDRLARVAVAYAESAGFDVEYDEMQSTFVPGFELYGVRLFSPENEKQPLVELSSLGVRTALLPLLTGKAGVYLTAEGYGGEAKAKISSRGASAWAEGEIKHVNLEALPQLREKLKVPVTGSFDAKFDVEVMPTLTETAGTVDIVLGDLNLGQGMLLGLAKFPGADFGDLRGTVLVEGGKLIFDRFAGDGQDVKATIEGDIALREPVSFSQLNLTLKLGLSQRIEEALGFAFPLLGLSKSPQGEYVRRVQGTLASPR